MNLKNRLEKLESNPPRPMPEIEYSRAQIEAMSIDELQRATRVLLNAPAPKLTAADRQRQSEYSRYLATLPNDEIIRLQREKLGSCAETKRQW